MAADTIFALSTGSGAAGIAIIRVSGPETRLAVERLAGRVPLPRMATLRVLRDPERNEPIDSAVVLFFPGPHSFTGEDLAEFQVHGSLAVIRHLLRCLAGVSGLRAAEAGEFSHRAFVNGKMDLIEVEALGDLLSAETEAQARLARLYQGNLRAAASRWRETLIELTSLTEAYIDFSDEGDVSEATDSSAEQEILLLAAEIGKAIEGLETGERIRRGFRIAVLGPPNAGKSSLVNALANRDVAITSAIPGTTRDTIEVHLDLNGLPVILIDTAGLRDSDDPLEQAGIARAHAAAAQADLVLWLSPDGQASSSVFPDALLVASKADHIDSQAIQNDDRLRVSVRAGLGLGRLMDTLYDKARIGLDVSGDAVLVVHARQAFELSGARSALERAAARSKDSLELRAEELRSARRYLDRLTGRIDYDQILGAIFSRFCIGK
jgi:tRNA modification GTPase